MIKEYFKTYQEELELIDAQNRVELDLYSLVAYIIRATLKEKNISLRDVTARRKTEFSSVFVGDSGFPDFIIRTREKSNKASILGAVEIKYFSQDLDSEENIDQLKGHINFYKKVIYTNGLEWRFYDNSIEQSGEPVVLGEFSNGKFTFDNEASWSKLLNKLNSICW